MRTFLPPIDPNAIYRDPFAEATAALKQREKAEQAAQAAQAPALPMQDMLVSLARGGLMPCSNARAPLPPA